MNREEKGVKINGEYLKQLQFSDSVLPISESLNELSKQIKWSKQGKPKLSFKMNRNKQFSLVMLLKFDYENNR